MSRRRNKILIPEASNRLERLKTKVLVEDGLISRNTIPQNITNEVAKSIGVDYSPGYNGNITTKDAGKIGGNIGGRMVRELVKMAQKQLAEKS